MKKMTFDPVKDITAIAPVLSYYNVLTVGKDGPHQSLKDVVASARANPAKVFYGSAGIGSSNHLSGELLAAKTGTQMVHVPYKGNAPAMTDQLSNGALLPVTSVDQLGYTLGTWFGLSAGQLAGIFPNVLNFNASARNLGFLA